MVPPMQSVFEQVGAELPTFLQGAGKKSANEVIGEAKAVQSLQSPDSETK